MLPLAAQSLFFLPPSTHPMWLVVVFVMGACVGSFLNVCIYRIPMNLSTSKPGSHCFACKKPIKWHDNIPILSYLILGGKCRNCGAKFSWRYAGIELLTALLWLAIWWINRDTPGVALVYLGITTALVTASFIDIDHYILPDRITVGGILLGPVISVLVPALHDPGALFQVPVLSESTFVQAMIGLAAGYWLACLITGGWELATKKMWEGYGDPRLLAAIGGFLGWQAALWSFGTGLLVATVGCLLPRLAAHRLARNRLGKGLAVGAVAWMGMVIATAHPPALPLLLFIALAAAWGIGFWLCRNDPDTAPPAESETQKGELNTGKEDPGDGEAKNEGEEEEEEENVFYWLPAHVVDGGLVLAPFIALLVTWRVQPEWVNRAHEAALAALPLSDVAGEALLRSLFGLAVGYWVISFIAWIGELVIGREAMGYGDIKLLAAIGAFLGWEATVWSLFSACFFGAMVGLPLILAGKRELGRHIPFGPYIALGCLAWMLGTRPLFHDYLDYILRPFFLLMPADHPNLVLVGFMGTGKSTVGRLLAGRLKRRFIDMDTVIEQREGKPISRIFAEDGEARFRGLECALSLDLSIQTNRVIACGGGIVLNPANLEALGMTGVVVCLSARPETVLARVAASDERPLLDGDKEERIRSLYAERRPLYDAIELQVSTDDKDPEEIAGEVERLYEKAG